MTTIDSTTKQALNIAVLTVSDTRNKDNDTSGQNLNDAAVLDGHNVLHKKIEIDGLRIAGFILLATNYSDFKICN
jgi:molybdenum cofactor biosynthesis protein B